MKQITSSAVKTCSSHFAVHVRHWSYNYCMGSMLQGYIWALNTSPGRQMLLQCRITKWQCRITKWQMLLPMLRVLLSSPLPLAGVTHSLFCKQQVVQWTGLLLLSQIPPTSVPWKWTS
jgi:hypothetical protein